MIPNLKLPLAIFVLGSVLAPASVAGGFGISIGKHGKHGAIGLSIGHGWCPPPVNHCPPPRVWNPGCHETIVEKIWVAGREERVWVAPQYATHYDHCGRPYSVCIRDGYWTTVCRPGHYEYRNRQVWRDGYWKGHQG